MQNQGRRVFAIASPVIVLGISVVTLARYPEGVWPEMLIAAAIVGPLIAFGVWFGVRIWRERKAATSAAAALSASNPESVLMLVEIDRRSARLMRQRSGSLGGFDKREFMVAVLGDGQVDLYRPAQRKLVVSLVEGVDIARFSTAFINRGTPVDEPSLRIEFLDGEQVDLVLYDAVTGKWPRSNDLDRINRKRRAA